jgi:tetratricopeptide (TPR) repeat protein
VRVAIVVMLVARLASADSRSAADEFAEGQRHYQAGNYAAAAGAFVRAYSIQADPAYLFNAAQAFRNANQCAKAYEYYSKFIAAVPAAPNAADIHEHLANLEPCAKEGLVEPVPPKPEVVTQPPPPPPPRRDVVAPGRGKRIAGIASIGVGALALAGGVVFTAKVGRHESDANGLCVRGTDGKCPWSAALTAELARIDAAAARDRTRAIASFAVGGVAIAGGIALYMFGRSAHTAGDEHGIAIVPTTDGVMATIARTF